MRKLTWLMLVPVAALAAACGRSRGPALDDALKSDLALASQAQIGNPTAISPAEAGYAPQSQYAASRAAQPVARRTSAPARRTSSTSRSSGSRSSSGGGYYPAPAPTTIEKHTGRDAAIGAAAGAVIGATSSRDKVKGGLIGAAAGGILGAVIGNNVDVKKVPW